MWSFVQFFIARSINHSFTFRQIEVSAALTYLYKLYKRLRADQKTVLKNQEQNLKRLEDRILQLEKVLTNQLKHLQQKNNMLLLNKTSADGSQSGGFIDKYLPSQRTLKIQLFVIIVLFLLFLYYIRAIHSRLEFLHDSFMKQS
jgi:hypothetical protein